jgi:phosphoribosylformylglycinamidine synthase
MRFEARVDVAHLPGVLDPQGATVERALPALGYDNVTEVSIGKTIRLVVDAPDERAARAQVEEMCERLLANPVIESYSVSLASLAAGQDTCAADARSAADARTNAASS